MREIKFKAVKKSTKEIFKVTRIDFEDGYIYYNNPTYSMTEYYSQEGDIEDFVLLQFTGLHDKNGKGIYEGDILEDEEHYRWEVTQIDGDWAIECNDMPGMQCLTMTKTEWYEVIGNIHENPELLESEE